jgi:hypothetical protein
MDVEVPLRDEVRPTQRGLLFPSLAARGPAVSDPGGSFQPSAASCPSLPGSLRRPADGQPRYQAQQQHPRAACGLLAGARSGRGEGAVAPGEGHQQRGQNAGRRLACLSRVLGWVRSSSMPDSNSRSGGNIPPRPQGGDSSDVVPRIPAPDREGPAQCGSMPPRRLAVEACPSR